MSIHSLVFRNAIGPYRDGFAWAIHPYFLSSLDAFSGAIRYYGVGSDAYSDLIDGQSIRGVGLRSYLRVRTISDANNAMDTKARKTWFDLRQHLLLASVIAGVRWGARLAEMDISMRLQCAVCQIALDCFID